MCEIRRRHLVVNLIGRDRTGNPETLGSFNLVLCTIKQNNISLYRIIIYHSIITTKTHAATIIQKDPCLLPPSLFTCPILKLHFEKYPKKRCALEVGRKIIKLLQVRKRGEQKEKILT